MAIALIFPDVPGETVNTGRYTEQCDIMLHSISLGVNPSNLLGQSRFPVRKANDFVLVSYLGCLGNHCAVGKK